MTKNEITSIREIYEEYDKASSILQKHLYPVIEEFGWTYISNIEFSGTHICLYVEWHGSYQSKDTGTVSIPLDLLEESKDVMVQYLKDVKEGKDLINKQLQAEKVRKTELKLLKELEEKYKDLNGKRKLDD